MRSRYVAVTIGCLALVSAGVALNWHYFAGRGATARHIEFNRDIRPILNQNCMSCHGGVKQQGNVSFIYREQALGKGKSGRPTVVPGKPNASELIARVTSKDPETRMPYHAPPLQPEQIALLKKWIRQGAPWEEYWAFVPPKSQSLPAVNRTGWVRQPLDRFILARLEKEGLQPSLEADRAALLRRVSFDLTGLPPTPEELSAFLADTSPHAYEKQVDRLLASPSYGERWAAVWLDLARYADSKGYDQDFNRTAWPYRDWVIKALNRNVPYDEFVIKQLAGDLLPNATVQDRIATAFQRLTPVNEEGGTDDEEFRVVAVMDRVATTWSVLNGVTINCVQCHSHPYDPIRHDEYYRFLSFYNTSRDSDRGDDWPTLQVARLASEGDAVGELQDQRDRVIDAIVAKGRAMANATAWRQLPIMEGWMDEATGIQRHLAEVKRIRDWAAHGDRKAYFDYYADYYKRLSAEFDARRNVRPKPLTVVGGEIRAEGTVPAISVYEVLAEAPVAPLAAVRVEVPAREAAVARHSPEDGFIVDHVDISMVGLDGMERPLNIRYFLPDAADGVVEALAAPMRGPDASKPMSIGRFSANPKLSQTRWIVGVPEEPVALPPGSRLKLRLFHSQTISSKPAIVRRMRLQTTDDARWVALMRDPMLAQQRDELAKVQLKLEQADGVAVPIMAEQHPDFRRQTLLFDRGNFLTKVGPALQPDIPELFGKLPESAPRDRLTMARWFFSSRQPLTARVAVNRFWEQLFGTGIVETLEDFGSSGATPSHPELLDWLALHFQNELKWDMKGVLREIVTSATYRQSAKATSELLQKDPRNRLLARGPQQRLTAEMVRDQALRASGLLSRKMFGEPVRPPQPTTVSTFRGDKWVPSTGEDRHRRAIYTYLRRSAIYPTFIIFDGSDRAVSLARRIPTNTPLQALVTLNDPVYHEAANALAQHMLAFKVDAMTLSSADLLAERLNYGARRVLSRNLSSREIEVLKAFYADVRRAPTPEGSANKGSPLAQSEQAAFAAAAAVLLNLDAALAR